MKTLPGDVQSTLQKIRKTIKQTVPKADEVISYGIPCFKLNGQYLIYFAAWAKHISFYPINENITTSIKELKGHKFSKGTVKFPLDKPIPKALIQKIVKYQVKKTNERIKQKKAK